MLQRIFLLIGISCLSMCLITLLPTASNAQIFGKKSEPPAQEENEKASTPDKPPKSVEDSAAPSVKKAPPPVKRRARPLPPPKAPSRARPQAPPKARPQAPPRAAAKAQPQPPKGRASAKTAIPEENRAPGAPAAPPPESGPEVAPGVAPPPAPAPEAGPGPHRPPPGAGATAPPPMGDGADCFDLQDCIAAIRGTLNNMSTPDELRKLDFLTRKAEAFLAAEEGGSPTDRPMRPGPPAPEEQAAMIERLERLEAKLAAVEEKSDANEKRIQAKQSSKGFKIFGPGESVFGIGALLQTRMETEQSGAPNGDNWSYGMYIRRMRLLFSGQLTKWLNFFVETEQANFGKNGDWGGRMFIQDAYVEFNLHPTVQIDVGMMLPSLSRHAMQSAGSLLGMDYHSTLVKYPTGSTMVWRDIGIKIRGLVLRDRLDYRFAVWNGVHGGGDDPRNPKDYPRLSGRLTVNIFEPEGGGGVGGMFFDGLYLKKDGKDVVSVKRVLSIGASFDWQPDLNVKFETAAANDPEDYSDYIAAAGDVFWDIPFGNRNIFSANGQVDFFYYNHGNRETEDGYWYYNTSGNTSNYTGWGLFGEFGIRYSKIQALFAMEVYESTKTDEDVGDYLNFSGGLNYYLAAHAATFKLYVGSDKAGSADWKTSLKFQLQLSF